MKTATAARADAVDVYVERPATSGRTEGVLSFAYPRMFAIL
jgi:hypothetical protein